MLARGQAVGPYTVVSIIGTGGMGTVYLARDERLGRQVAIKILNATTAGDAEQNRRRLVREARAASSLNHPNICHIYDVGETGGQPWIAMEYVEGPTLQAIIPRDGLPPRTVARIGAQLADALAHAHERGLVHRDLKSVNVVCDRESRPKILDFGLAALLARVLAEQVTRADLSLDAERIAGTVAYMAPEVLRGGEADERSDLWSLGVLLYEMLSGSLPFPGSGTYDVAAAILERTPAPLPAPIPGALSRLVMRLLEKDPSARYRRADEVKAVLESLLDDEPVSAPRRARSVVAPLAMGAVVLVVVAGLTWWQLARARPISLGEERLVSTFDGSRRAPSYSPDGSMLAFAAPDAKGVDQIWVTSLAQEHPLQITFGDVEASRPRWSPRNDAIVYGVKGSGIWSVSPLGGGTHRLIERGLNPNFSRDGGRIVFETASSSGELFTASPDGSNLRKVEGVPARFYTVPRGAAFSPDGSTIAFFHPEAGPNGDLWLIPATGGTARKLTSDLREGGWPVWTPDGRWIVFASMRAGSRTLWQIPSTGGEPRPLTTGAGEDDQPDIAADGRHVTFTNVRNHWEMRVRDLTNGSERTVLNRTTEMILPMFSPDGERILFFGHADYAVAIMTVAVDGTDLRQLTGGRELNHEPRWGADGQSVYFFQSEPTLTFRRVPAVGGASVEFRKWRWETHNAPLFDPSGRFIVYLRQNLPGAARGGPPDTTIIEEADTGIQRELPRPHMHPGRWSRDGKSIVGWRHDGKAWICPADGGACHAVTTGSVPVWSADDRRIFVLRPGNDPSAPQELWSAGTDGSDERMVASLGVFRSIDRFFDLSKKNVLVWTPFVAGRYQLWTATVR